MRTLRYLSLLGLFVSVGTALAIGLALGTSRPPAAPAAKGPAAAPVSVRTPKKSQPERKAPGPAAAPLPPSLAGEPVPAPDTAPLPPATLKMVPHPAIAEQISEPPGKDAREALQKIYKALVGPLTAAPAAAPEMIPAPAAAPNRAAAPAVPIPPAAPPADAAAPPPQGPSIQVDLKSAEGDDRLKIQFPETDVREVLEALAEYGNLNILTSKSVQGKISVRLRNVSVSEALEAVLRQAGFVSKREGSFIYVGNPQEIDGMQQTYGQIKTRVYRPNYVSSAELESLIKPMLSEKTGLITKFEEPKNKSQSGSSGGGSGGSGSEMEGGAGYAGAEVIVVRDYEAVLAQIDQIVAEVDVRPMQVAIEAMILSVKLKDDDKLGINFQFLKEKYPELVFNVGTKSAFQGGGSLSVAFTDSNLGAFIDALQETNETNVIATPRLMVVNKQKAEIHIGREQGYIASTTQTETATTATMQMLQTGTLLRLRPFLSSDGLIRMDVHPELSSGEVVEKANTLVPDKEITQVTTNIMVRDGCTVIIGGLIREQLAKNTQQIAGLGSLPVVGFLFRNRTETTERQEILVLITPHIVYEPEACREGEKAASEFHRRQAVVAEKMCPLGKRSLGRRYVRLAQNAWAAGDRETALRYAELAVHFDPESRAAIDLRSNIWQGQPCGKYTLQQAAPAGENPLDGPEIAGWLLEDLQHEPITQPAPKHPLDPGRPGTHRDMERPRIPQ